MKLVISRFARRRWDRQKLLGSPTDTFDDSNNEDAMTRSSLSSSSPSPSPSSLCSVLGLFTIFSAALLLAQPCNAAYYGKLIGKLSQLHHGVSGEVYAVDERTLFIKDFTYDGEAPAAYFYVGSSKNPNGNGIRVRDERGTTNLLKRYRKKGITLTLPEGKTLNNIKWFSVWCDEFAVNFGDVKIPRGFDYPRPHKLASLTGIHGVGSEPVVIVDAQTLLVPGFSYDGEAPDAKFWVGAGPSPSPQGIRIPDENGKITPLRRYDRKTIVLTLPGDLTVHQLGHFGVWCEAFAVDFAHIEIPQNLNVPPSLKMLGVSPQNLRGGQGQDYVEAPAPKAPAQAQAQAQTQFQYRPTTYRPILRRDDHELVQVVQSIDYKLTRPQVDSSPADFGQFQADGQFQSANRRSDAGSFGDRNSPITTGPIFSHRDPNRQFSGPSSPASHARLLRYQGSDLKSKLNCEVLEDDLAFEVRWAVAGDSIVVQLVGKLESGEYMAFGLSPDLTKSVMVGGDPVVAWIDKQTLQGYAEDYFLDAKSQCSGGRGSCPDERIKENTNSVRLLNAAMVNGYSIVTYQRPLRASDELDLPFYTNRSQAIIWAIGPLNERREVSFHSSYLKTDRLIEFGRPPVWNCPMPHQEQSQAQAQAEADFDKEPAQETHVVTTRRPSQRPPATPAPAPKTNAWDIPPIQCDEPEDGVFYAQMGPTGGKHGYPAITGHVGWGISWYINGLLIPEIHVVRGKKYSFVVEGGMNPDTPARYHPFYITDDPVGGYLHKTPEEKSKVKIFAGVRRQRGQVRPTGVGRLCNWVPDQNQPQADEFSSFGAYQRTLTLECDPGEPGIVEWTPDANTPDTVYYQCFTHRYLGWKIHVHDSCDISGSASETREVYVSRPEDDPEAADSILAPSKVTVPQQSPDYHHHHQPPQPHRQMALTERDNYYYHYQPQQQPQQQQQPPPPFMDYSPKVIRYAASSAHLKKPNPLTAIPLQPFHHAYPHHRLPASFLEGPEFQQFHHHPPQYYQYHHHHHPHPHLDPYQPQEELLLSQDPGVINNNNNNHNSNGAAGKVTDPIHDSLADPRGHASQQSVKYSFPPFFPNALKPATTGPFYHQQPSGKTQLMLVRRPVYPRRPPSSPSSSPTFMERKKSVLYPKTRYPEVVAPKQVITKLTKFQPAGSEAPLFDQTLKPARNTGFDPDSIVIEGGFKPIIRNQVYESAEEQRPMASEVQERKQEEGLADQEEGFEPVFQPSPIFGEKSRKRKKNKFAIEGLDDMEMAAARYLPPKMKDPGVSALVAFDGRPIDDPNLPRSILALERKQQEQEQEGGGKSRRLPSELLSRMPQFGKFLGELPPSLAAPGEISGGSRRSVGSSSSSSTKLSSVERKKRSEETGTGGTPKPSSSVNWDENSDTLASAGQTILLNLQYVVLTIILYYTI